jgi:hypothetical protein
MLFHSLVKDASLFHTPNLEFVSSKTAIVL